MDNGIIIMQFHLVHPYMGHLLRNIIKTSIFRQKAKSKKKTKSKEGNTRMMTSIIGSTGVHIVDINSNAEDQHLKSPSWKV